MNYADMKEAGGDLAKFAMTGSRIWAVVVTLACVASLLGAGWGFFRYAQADEVDRIDERVTALEKTTGEIKDAVDKQVEDTSEVIKGLLAAEMRVAAASRCNKPPGQREFENKRIEDLQTQYLKRAGSLYDVPSCAEL